MPRLPEVKKLDDESVAPMGEALVSSSERESFCCVALIRRTCASTRGTESVEKDDSLNSILMYLKLRRLSSEL